MNQDIFLQRLQSCHTAPPIVLTRKLYFPVASRISLTEAVRKLQTIDENGPVYGNMDAGGDTCITSLPSTHSSSTTEVYSRIPVPSKPTRHLLAAANKAIDGSPVASLTSSAVESTTSAPSQPTHRGRAQLDADSANISPFRFHFDTSRYRDSPASVSPLPLRRRKVEFPSLIPRINVCKIRRRHTTTSSVRGYSDDLCVMLRQLDIKNMKFTTSPTSRCNHTLTSDEDLIEFSPLQPEFNIKRDIRTHTLLKNQHRRRLLRRNRKSRRKTLPVIAESLLDTDVPYEFNVDFLKAKPCKSIEVNDINHSEKQYLDKEVNDIKKSEKQYLDKEVSDKKSEKQYLEEIDDIKKSEKQYLEEIDDIKKSEKQYLDKEVNDIKKSEKQYLDKEVNDKKSEKQYLDKEVSDKKSEKQYLEEINDIKKSEKQYLEKIDDIKKSEKQYLEEINDIKKSEKQYLEEINDIKKSEKQYLDKEVNDIKKSEKQYLDKEVNDKKSEKQYLDKEVSDKKSEKQYLEEINDIKKSEKQYLEKIDDIKKSEKQYLEEINDIKKSEKQYLEEIDDIKKSEKQYLEEIDDIKKSEKQYLDKEVNDIKKSEKQYLDKEVNDIKKSEKQYLEEIDDIKKSEKQYLEEIDDIKKSEKQYLDKEVNDIKKSEKQYLEEINDIKKSEKQYLDKEVNDIKKSEKQYLDKEVNDIKKSEKQYLDKEVNDIKKSEKQYLDKEVNDIKKSEKQYLDKEVSDKKSEKQYLEEINDIKKSEKQYLEEINDIKKSEKQYLEEINDIKKSEKQYLDKEINDIKKSEKQYLDKEINNIKKSEKQYIDKEQKDSIYYSKKILLEEMYRFDKISYGKVNKEEIYNKEMSFSKTLEKDELANALTVLLSNRNSEIQNIDAKSNDIISGDESFVDSTFVDSTFENIPSPVERNSLGMGRRLMRTMSTRGASLRKHFKRNRRRTSGVSKSIQNIPRHSTSDLPQQSTADVAPAVSANRGGIFKRIRLGLSNIFTANRNRRARRRTRSSSPPRNPLLIDSEALDFTEQQRRVTGVSRRASLWRRLTLRRGGRRSSRPTRPPRTDSLNDIVDKVGRLDFFCASPPYNTANETENYIDMKSTPETVQAIPEPSGDTVFYTPIPHAIFHSAYCSSPPAGLPPATPPSSVVSSGDLGKSSQEPDQEDPISLLFGKEVHSGSSTAEILAFRRLSGKLISPQELTFIQDVRRKKIAHNF